MVYQIYYQADKNSNRKVLFDIEMYLKENPKRTGKNDQWYVEMHSYSFISGAVDFILDAAVNNICAGKHRSVGFKAVDLFEFTEDCNKLEELRGWLWETHSNRPRTMEEASKDKGEWLEYIKSKVYEFANKYGLYVNED